MLIGMFSFFVLIILALFYVSYRIFKAMKLKNDALYHDINSSLIVLKLAVDSFKDFSLEFQGDNKINSLINVLEEGITQMDESFRTWDK